MRRKKFKQFIFFFFLFACLGYFREFFFVHINNIMYMKYYKTTSTLAVPSIMKLFETVSYDALYYSKYFYTIIWSLIFLLANFLALRKLTHNNMFIKIMLYAYILMFVLAFISMCYGYFVKGKLQSDEYTLSRWLLGIAQSPLICLILLASEKLYNKSFLQHGPEEDSPDRKKG